MPAILILASPGGFCRTQKRYPSTKGEDGNKEQDRRYASDRPAGYLPLSSFSFYHATAYGCLATGQLLAAASS